MDDDVAVAADEPAVPDLPPPPAHLGVDLAPALRSALHELFWTRSSQVGEVYRAMVLHPGAGPSELLVHTTCANAGVVGNRRAVVRATFDAVTDFSPSVALQAARTIRTLVKRAEDTAVVTHLEHVEQRLTARAEDEHAVEAENVELQQASEVLAKKLVAASGVYVYTYPHYWRHPYIADTDRKLLKVGRTGTKAWKRVVAQARQTGMPEDPVLLRVYVTEEPVRAEGTFHMLIDSAGHPRSEGVAVGKEWFVTTLDFCDAIARALSLETLAAPTSATSA